jgi:preprotein translocase subunit SecD
MKTTIIFLFMVLIMMCSCNKGDEKDASKADFGIYEIVDKQSLSESFMDSMKSYNLKFERNNKRPIIGYIPKSDFDSNAFSFQNAGIKPAITAYPVDEEEKYHAVVALKSMSVVGIADIQSTQPSATSVEIRFNRKGAKKWAEFTRNHINKQVAFLINGEIYSMPRIAAEIRNGRARIDGFENEGMAENISRLLTGE